MKKLLMATLALVMMAGARLTPTPAPAPKPQPKADRNFSPDAPRSRDSYIAARGWARDAQPYRIESVLTADSKGKEGKSGVWRASSPRRCNTASSLRLVGRSCA